MTCVHAIRSKSMSMSVIICKYIFYAVYFEGPIIFILKMSLSIYLL